MADVKISELTSATTPLSGTEIVPIVQDGGTVKATVDDIAALAPFPVTSVNTQTGAVVLSAADVGAATTAQGALADTAVQPGDLGTAAMANTTDFATAAQGALADTAVQPGDVLPVYIDVKNTSGGSLTAGTPIYATGSVGDTNVATVSAARADDPAKIAVAILNQTLSNNGTGTATIIGQLTGLDTSALSKGNVYLAPAGGLTNTKPTNSAYAVQWLGTCERVNSTTGTLFCNITDPQTPDSAFATAAQGAKADTAVQPADIANMLETSDIGVSVQAYNANTVVDSSYVHTDNNYTTAEKNKLAGIAAGAEVNVNADWNAVSGDAQILNKPTLGTASTLASDTDTTLAANSDTRIATQKAVKTYVDNSVTGLMDFKGSADCSGNPNYPSASKGDAYVVSVAGKIGGASGVSVDVGDVYVASADNAGGTQASVGSSWFILEHNLQGALLSANNLSDLANKATSRSNLLPSYAGNANKVLAINTGATDVEWIPAGTGSGTVTSVGLSVPTGLSVTGSPVTTSGTLAVTFSSGYSIPTTASQANWDTAYTDRLKWDGGSTGLNAATGRSSLLPSYAANGGKVLAVNAGATDVEWITATGGSLPSQTGNSGKFLTTDGTNASWATVTAAATKLQVLTRSATTTDVLLSNGSLPVLNRSGSTINVSVV